MFSFLNHDRMPRAIGCTWPLYDNYRDDTKQRSRGFAYRSDHFERLASVREMSSDPSHLPVPCLALTILSIQSRGSSIVLDVLVSLSMNHLGFTSFTSQRICSAPHCKAAHDWSLVS
jgi:hypothetical protein